MSVMACERPCAECPWRRDVAPGKFGADRFRSQAHTSYDMDRAIFQCHLTDEQRPLICAGFLERGAEHNMTVRVAYATGSLDKIDRSAGLALYDDYRAMAMANGVQEDDPCLIASRSGSRS